jgi:calcineurin-like phosphoesterase
MKILCVGDVVGDRGVRFAASKIPFYSFCGVFSFKKS